MNMIPQSLPDNFLIGALGEFMLLEPMIINT